MEMIKDPTELLREFPAHVLTIHKKYKGEMQKTHGIPENIYIRLEVEQKMLYIDTRFLTAAGLIASLIEWRKLPSYRGTLLKRMAAGTGKVEGAVNCAAFDLIPMSEQGAGDVDDSLKRIRPRRGRPLTVHKRIRYQKQAGEVAGKLANFNDQVGNWREAYGHLPIYEELHKYIKDAKRTYEEAYNMLSVGRRSKVRAERRPSAPKKAIHIAYIRCTGLDELITKDSEAIYKLIRKFVQDERGNFTLQEREYIPPMDKSEWIGRYEQGEDKDGENAYKHLYVPISIIKAGVYNNDILGYKHDKRYLETCQKYIGFRGFRCAKFDLGALDD